MVVMYLDELRGIFTRQRQAGVAVRFVADDEFECPESLLLRVRYDLNRLIGGKDHGTAIPGQGAGSSGEFLGVCGRGIGQIMGADVLLVFVDLGIRTDDKSMRRLQRLGNQGNRWREKQHPPIRLSELFHEPERRQGLTGAASHDEFAPAVLPETLDDSGDGFLLMRAWRFLSLEPHIFDVGKAKLTPVDRTIGKVFGHSDHNQTLDNRSAYWRSVFRYLVIRCSKQVPLSRFVQVASVNSFKRSLKVVIA